MHSDETGHLGLTPTLPQGSIVEFPSFEQSLRNALIESLRLKDKFVPEAFFNEWFRKLGVAHFFLFKKNLSCTNIQYAELIALIRLHTKGRVPSDAVRDLHFRTRTHFLNDIATIFQTFKLPHY